MSQVTCVLKGIAIAGGLMALVIGLVFNSQRVRADDENGDSKVQIGFQIAPVNLNMKDKDHTKSRLLVMWLCP